MYITNLKLKNFRNIKELVIQFSPHINLIIAPNGTGKTNILEAISLVSSGKSPRTSYDLDLIPFDLEAKNGENFTKISAQSDTEKDPKEIIFNKIESEFGPSIRKTYKIKTKNTTRRNFSKSLHSVYFSPESIGYLEQGFSKKRDLFDNIIEVSDIEYGADLAEFKKALRNRNIVLKKLQNSGSSTELIYWTKVIINSGVKIIQKRWATLGDYSKLLSMISKELFDNKWLGLDYLPHIDSTPLDNLEEIQLTYLNELKRLNSTEISAGKTLKGPHRDKWTIKLDDHDISKFGSRGQQRLAILGIFLAFYEKLKELDATKPILLLDDVTSELDSKHITLLREKLIESNTQTFMTSTQKEVAEIFGATGEKVNVVELDKLL